MREKHHIFIHYVFIMVLTTLSKANAATELEQLSAGCVKL